MCCTKYETCANLYRFQNVYSKIELTYALQAFIVSPFLNVLVQCSLNSTLGKSTHIANNSGFIVLNLLFAKRNYGGKLNPRFRTISALVFSFTQKVVYQY